MYEGFRIAKIETDSIANGIGIRVVLWCQGCSVQCNGCHNPQTWDVNGGRPYVDDDDNTLFKELSKAYVRGVTFSGGHPLEPCNIHYCTDIAKRIKLNYPTKDIWLYSGWLYDDIKDLEIMKYVDVLVDGPYIQDRKDVRLPYCGSNNQRVIDVQQSLKQNKVIVFTK